MDEGLARAEVARDAEAFAQMAAVDQEGDILDQSESWIAYQEAKHWNAEQAKVVQQMQMDRPGFEIAEIATLQAEQDFFVDGLVAVGVGDGSE